MADSATLGARIRALREKAGVLATDLAAHIGLDPSAMSHLETGKRNLRPNELLGIAEFLGVSQLAILDESSLVGRLPVSPRASGEIQRTALSRLTGLAELHEVLAAGGLPAQPKLTGVPLVEPGMWLKSAEELAEFARERLRGETEDGDPFSTLVKRIEEQFAIDVLVEEAEGSALIGAAITDAEFPLIFVDAGQPTPRALFTLAHELAHILLMDGEPIFLDETLTPSNDVERLANAFAASFLMPEEEVQQHISGYGRGAESLARMIISFGVSFESLIYRLHNLRVINAAGRDNLRSVGWAGLLSELDNDELRLELIAAKGSRPERRPPLFLTSRAIAGALRGHIGPAPVGGLLGIGSDECVALLAAIDENVKSAISTDYSEDNEDAVEGSLYEGSPV